MITLHEKILAGLLQLIEESQNELTPDNPAYLDSAEIRPTSEELADDNRFAVISQNDPADPEGWLDEEIASWPPRSGQFEEGWGKNFNEPRSQAWYLSFTITFTLYYSEMGLSHAEALAGANNIVARIRRAIQADSTKRPGQGKVTGLKDDYGLRIIPYYRAVKKVRLVGSGSEEEPNFSGKMWLRFVAESSHT